MANEELYDDFDFSSAPESDSDSDSSDDEPRKILNLYLNCSNFIYKFLGSRKKSIDTPQPMQLKTASATNPSQPPGLKAPVISVSATLNKPQNVASITVSQNFQKESAETVNKVVSPPPILQPPQVTKIAGPSFASALAAATAQSNVSVTASQLNSSAKLSSVKQFNAGAFEELESFFVKKFPSKETEENVSKFLATSYQNLPDNYELERNRQYCPKQPYAMPSYYQSEPPQILSNPSIFERFDLDTLFFIFYYQQKTYPQYQNTINVLNNDIINLYLGICPHGN